MAICKIYDFKYTTYAHMQFINAWHIEIVLTGAEKKFLCFGIRNFIILCYRDFLTRWENLHRENFKKDQISQITIR